MLDINTTILEWLAIYKFLSISQMEKLGLPVKRKTLYTILQSLREDSRNLIDKTSFNYNPKYGKLEDMHYLTPKGKKYLIREHGRQETEIKMPLGNSRFYKDYQHRKKTIDIHIALRTAFESHNADIVFYDNYFEGKKKSDARGRETATKIQLVDGSIRADSLFQVACYPSGNLLFAVEMHNGYRVKKICEQLLHYADALSTGIISSKYDLYIGCRVLTVFEQSSTMYSAIERLKEHPKFRFLQPYFLFKPYKELIHSPIIGWHTLDGTRTDL